MDWSLYLAIVSWTTLYRSGADWLMLFWVLYTACELITQDFKVECKSLVSIVLVWDTNKIFTFILLFLLPFIPGSGARVSDLLLLSQFECLQHSQGEVGKINVQWTLETGMGAYCLHDLLFSAWDMFLLPPHTRMDAFLEICLISLSRMWMN